LQPQPWKTLSTHEVYRNPWMRIREDIAEMPNGRTTVYGVAELGECVGVLPFIDKDRVLMVRQYRYVQNENWRWEMPTGGVRAGESPEAAAQRELMEEIGYRAGNLERVHSFLTSKSVCDETAHLYIGRDLERTSAPQDETEFLEVETMEFGQALEMVLHSKIRDSMTVIAVLLAARMRERNR
jgi:ADP-ribose diphosphatase